MRRVLTLLLFAATAARADFPLNRAPLRPTTYRCSYPAVAAVGSGPVVAWSEALPTAFRNHLRFNDGEDVVVAAGTCANCYGEVDVAANSREAFVAALRNLYRIDDATRRTVLLGPQPAGRLVRIVASGDRLLVVTSEGATMNATLLDRDGNRLSATLPFVRTTGSITSAVASSDGFALAWYGDDGSPHAVVLRAADLMEGKVAAPVALPGGRRYGSVQIAADRNGFLVTWVQDDRQFSAIVGLRLTPDLQPVGVPRMIAEYADSAGPVYGRGLVATAGGFALLVAIQKRDYSTDGVLLRLRDDGMLLDSVDIIAGDQEGSLTLDGDTAVIAMLLRQAVHVIRVEPNGVQSDVLVSVTRPVQRTIALFPTASGYAAVWTESYSILFGRFTASGAPLDGDGITIATPVYTDVAAASNGDAVLVVWSQMYGYANTAFVPLADPATFTTHLASSNIPSPIAVVAAGRVFVIAWTYQSWEFKVYARLVSAVDGSIAPETRTVIDLPWQSMIPQWVTVSAPRVAWNGTYFLFAWQQAQHWDDVNEVQGTAPRKMQKGDPFVQLVTASLVPVGTPVDLGHGPQDHTDFAGLTVAPMVDGWLATWLRTGDDPAMFSARLDFGGTTRDPIGGSVVPWGGATVPPILGATRFGALRANGARFDTLLPDGRTLPFTDLPENATIDAVCLECPLPSIAYSLRLDDGSERAYAGALTARRRGAAAR